MERKERIELMEKPDLFKRITSLGLETFKCVKMDNFQLVHPIYPEQINSILTIPYCCLSFS